MQLAVGMTRPKHAGSVAARQGGTGAAAAATIGVMNAPGPISEPARRSRSFGGDVVVTVGGKALFVVMGTLLTVVVARELGPTDQGTFAVTYSLALLLVQLGSVGLPIAIPYFAARDEAAQRAVALNALRLLIPISALLAGGVLLAKAGAPELLPGVGWVELGITLGALPASLGTLYLQSVLLGQQRMVAYSLAEVLQVAAALVGVVVVFAVRDASVAGVLAIVSAGRYLGFIASFAALRRTVFSQRIPRPGLLGEMVGHASRVYLVSLLVFALVRLDLLLVNGVLGADDAGQYSVAAVIAEGLVIVPMVIGINLLPRLAKGHGTDLSAAVFRALLIVWGVICLLSIPGAAVGIPLLFGHDYDEAVLLYLLLLPGTFMVGMLNSLVTHYYVRGYPSSLIWVWVIALSANVGLNLALLEPLGVAAAPLISSATYALVLAAHVRVLAKEIGGLRALVPNARDVVRLGRAAFAR